MSQAFSVAASLSFEARQNLGIQAISRSVPISHLATEHQVSRKFVYQQGDKVQQALNEGEAHPHWLELLGFKRFQKA